MDDCKTWKLTMWWGSKVDICGDVDILTWFRFLHSVGWGSRQLKSKFFFHETQVALTNVGVVAVTSLDNKPFDRKIGTSLFQLPDVFGQSGFFFLVVIFKWADVVVISFFETCCCQSDIWTWCARLIFRNLSFVYHRWCQAVSFNRTVCYTSTTVAFSRRFWNCIGI